MGRNPIIDDKTLLSHARDVFKARGAFGTVSEVARRAGISEAAVFKRYSTKAALFVAALMPPEIDPAELVADEITDAREALEETGRRLLAYFRDVVPAGLHLHAARAAGLEDIGAHFGPDRTGRITEALATFLAERTVRKQMNAAEPRRAAQLMIAAIHSLAAYEVMGLHGKNDFGRAIPAFVDQIWAGLEPAPLTPEEGD